MDNYMAIRVKRKKTNEDETIEKDFWPQALKFWNRFFYNFEPTGDPNEDEEDKMKRTRITRMRRIGR